MNFDVKYKPSFAMIVANFDQDQSIMHLQGTCSLLSVNHKRFFMRCFFWYFV
jgi:hypothetical protein